jgi:hypothetical protein
MAKGKFDFLKSANYGQDEQGRIRMFSDDQRNYFKAENEARKKYDDAIKLKQQIQSETEAVILESQKEKAGFERMATIGKGAQAVIDPRMWARGAVGLGKMVFGQTIETTVTGGKAIGEQNAATNLYNQSKNLADQAAKIVKTDRPQAEALLKQSQALAEEANKFSQGEATNKIMGADGKLTTKEIIGKSALTALEVGSVLPIGGVARGSFMLSKTVPPAVQGTKTVAVGNAITRALGLGDIYQVTKTGLQQGLKQEVKQTIVGQAFKSTLQAPVTAGLMEMADDDGVNNYMGSVLTTGAGAFGLTLGFGYAGRILGNVAGEVAGNIAKKGGTTTTPTPTTPQKLLPLPQEAIQTTTEVNSAAADKLYNQANKLSARASKLTDKTKADELIKKSQDLIAQADKMPKEKVNVPLSAYSTPDLDPNVFEPKAQVIGTTVNEPLPNPYAKLGAFNPETDIPMVDLTETIKANNIDFNPDSTISINATRKAVDDLALLSGNEVGGKKLKINTDDPKYKEIYNNQIKPLVDRINEVDSKVEPLEYDTKINKIWNELDKIEIKQRELNNIDLLQVSKARRIKISTQLDNLAKRTDRLNKELQTTPKPAVQKVPLENLYGYEKLLDAKNLARTLNLLSKKIQTQDIGLVDKKTFIFKRIIVDNFEINEGGILRKKGDIPGFLLNKTEQKYARWLEENKFKVQNNYNQAQATPQPAVQKVPVEDVEMEVQKIYSELENAGISITPEQVRYTPNIQAVDEKLAKGEIPTPEEFDKGMKEYVNSTGKTEVIDGVQEELTGPMKRSAYVERLNKENPGLDLTSVEYQSAIVKDLEDIANNLIETNFDEAGRIARSINKNSNLQEIKVAELYNNKLIELGKYDELAQTSYALSVEATRSGQRTGILQEKKMGTPEYAIKQAQNARLNKLEPDIKKQVAKVKQEMSSVKVDQTFLFDILDNITCQ